MPGPYPEEFRREAVRLLKSSGKSTPELASELSVSPQSLRNWARQIDVDCGRAEGLTSDGAKSCAGCAANSKFLSEEREILTNAAAFFASMPR